MTDPAELIEQSIDAMEQQYGSLVTWRGANNCVAIDMPQALVDLCNSANDVQQNIAFDALLSMVQPQLNRLTNEMLWDIVDRKACGGSLEMAHKMVLFTACEELKDEYAVAEPLVVKSGNLLFDENNPLCQLIEVRVDGDTMLFLQCLDEQSGFPKRYCGVVRAPILHDEIQRIMLKGAKWPDLPDAS